MFGNNVAKVVNSENGIRQSPIPMTKMVDERTDRGWRVGGYSDNFLLQPFLVLNFLITVLVTVKIDVVKKTFKTTFSQFTLSSG